MARVRAFMVVSRALQDRTTAHRGSSAPAPDARPARPWRDSGSCGRVCRKWPWPLRRTGVVALTCAVSACVRCRIGDVRLGRRCRGFCGLACRAPLILGAPLLPLGGFPLSFGLCLWSRSSHVFTWRVMAGWPLWGQPVSMATERKTGRGARISVMIGLRVNRAYGPRPISAFAFTNRSTHGT